MNGEQLLLLISRLEELNVAVVTDCLDAGEDGPPASEPPEDCGVLEEKRERMNVVRGTSKLRGELLSELGKGMRGNLVDVGLEVVDVVVVASSVKHGDDW